METYAGSRGFTLIELLVALAIAGVLAVIAIPSYRSFVANERTKAAAQTLFFSMDLARSEAIKLNTTINVNAASGGWVGGWTVLEPANNTTVRTQGPLSGVTVSSGGVTTVAYGNNGRLTPANATPSFTICDTANLSKQYQLTIDPSGVPALSEGTQSCP